MFHLLIIFFYTYVQRKGQAHILRGGALHGRGREIKCKPTALEDKETGKTSR